MIRATLRSLLVLLAGCSMMSVRAAAQDPSRIPRNTVSQSRNLTDTVTRAIPVDSTAHQTVPQDTTFRTAADSGSAPIITSSTPSESVKPVNSSRRNASRSTPTIFRGSPSGLVMVNSDDVESLRYSQLRTGVMPGQSLLLRSASTLTPPMQIKNGWFATRLIQPQLLVVKNTKLPFSQNNSAMFAGRGTNTRTVAGFRVEIPFIRVIFAPQITASDNAYWRLRGNPVDYYTPPVPPGYEGRGFTFPYYFYTFPIDQPLRMGVDPVRNFNLGESTAMLTARAFQAGWSNENEWWGPGIRNAIVLSDNAPGFPHLFARTAHPVRTHMGSVDIKWLAGTLRESRYFDTLAYNNSRSIASIAATLQTSWDPNLTVGVARSVYSTAKNDRAAFSRWTDVFKSANKPNPRIPWDLWYTDKQPLPNGRDQILTLFARWVFPASGAEVYGEWGRTRLPKSLADFIIAPNHTQGYTIGMQWAGNAWAGGGIRLQAEITQLEQSATWRDGPVGSWYTSTRVIQGYTNQGEILGASIGPGASTQFIAADFIKSPWKIGGYLGRIRVNEDVHGNYGFPLYVGYCSHDVIVYPGVRGTLKGSFGVFNADFALQNRLDALFQNGGGCPNNGQRLDIRNRTLRFTYTPFPAR
ncbi:MAG: capsule assembly Wzi family protein [Gemmatimonadales bacterium]